MDPTRAAWDALHRQARYFTRYPSEEVIRFVARHLPPRRDGVSVLDAGSGAGRHAAFLSREGFRTFAVDYSREGLAETRAQLQQQGLVAHLAEARLGELPFPDGAFDAVIAYGTIYYADQRGVARHVQELHRVLRPGGSAFVLTRSVHDGRYGLGERVDRDCFRLSADAPSEVGMTVCFLSEADVRALFAPFSACAVDRWEQTQDDQRVRNSHWLITAKR